MAYDPRNALWFGTTDYSLFMPTPLRGAESNPEAWGESGTTLNGGGWGVHSWGSHKTYTYEWPESSSRQAAALLKSFRDGTYGRGLIYMLDPLMYDQNVAPARLADPSMAIDSEGSSLVYGVTPTAVANANWEVPNRLPLRSAVYTLSTAVAANFRGVEDATFIPIPTGYTLYLGAFYSSTGTGIVGATPLNTNGTLGTTVTLTAKAYNASTLVSNSFTGVRGVYVWVGKTSTVASTVTFSAFAARLIANEDIATKLTALQAGPWIGGSGNSGVRFDGVPTFVTNGPEQGGRIGYAASFREVGSTVYG